MMERYRIETVFKDGTRIKGYQLRNPMGVTETRVKREVEEMALLGYIENVRAREVNGKITLIGDGEKLRDIRVVQLEKEAKERKKFRVTHRLMNGRNTVGYILVDGTGRQIKVNLRDSLEMAKRKEIMNVAIQKYSDGSYKLRGKDNFKIESCPIVQMRTIQKPVIATIPEEVYHGKVVMKI